MSPLGPEASPTLLIISCAGETVTAGDQPAATEGVGVAATTASAPISCSAAPHTRRERGRVGTKQRARSFMTPACLRSAVHHERRNPSGAVGKSLTSRPPRARSALVL